MMAATPLITLTAILQNVEGEALGSPANPSKLRVDLCGFGQTVPVITGTSVLAQIEKTFLSNTSGAPGTVGTFSFPLWANDQITPPQTLYAVTAIDHLNRPVQSGLYSFNANGTATTIDLSNAQQITGPVGQLIYEIPFGTIPGSTFTLQYIPYNNQLIALYYNGIFNRPGIDYTVTGNTITLLNWQATAPKSLQAVYTTSGIAALQSVITEAPTGVFPGTIYGLSRTPLNGQLIALYYNGIFQRPGFGMDYLVSANNIALLFTTAPGANLYATYIPAP
jgi:hypothetical protein